MDEVRKTLNERIEKARSTQFSHLKDEIYLDNAGSSVYSQLHLQNYFQDLSNQHYGNPHSNNNLGNKTSDVVAQVRKRILDHFNTSLSHYTVIFTKNSTDALRLLSSSLQFKRREISPDATGCYEDGKSGSSECIRECDEDLNGDKKNKNEDATCGKQLNNSFNEMELNKNKKQLFAYLHDNHTSVVGIRGALDDDVVESVCVSRKEVEESLAKNQVLQSFTDAGEDVNLFAYPASSNFTGLKNPLSWISPIQKIHFLNHKSPWLVLLDASTCASTCRIDLSLCSPDFVCLSFYKIFGFPTGLGCLLVKNTSRRYLQKEGRYFGGGSVEMLLHGAPMVTVSKEDFVARFEDGTLAFLEVLAVKHGFEALQAIAGSMEEISTHTFWLATHAYEHLSRLTYSNNQKVVQCYNQTDFTDASTQTPLLTFNLRRTDGSFIGYSKVQDIACLHHINMRAGCLCNNGACNECLGLSVEDCLENYKLGKRCGDGLDMLKNKPTGVLRVSFGYFSTLSDADYFLSWLQNCFVEPGNAMLESGVVRDVPTAVESRMWIERLYVYPIKSCASVEISSSKITKRGLALDRWWVLVDACWRTLTQKRHPHLSAFKPHLSPDGEGLVVTYEGGSEDTISFSNEAEYLLIGSSSLASILQLIKEKDADETLDYDGLAQRFRANMLVHTNTPFEEDLWDMIEVAGHVFKNIDLCTRCKMVCFDQKTGKAGIEPLATLLSIPNRKVTFGILLSHLGDKEENNTILTGAEVKVLKLKDITTDSDDNYDR